MTIHIDDTRDIFVMPPRGANTSASARKRQPGGVIGRNIPRSATTPTVSRTAVTTADIAHMASTTPSPPSPPLSPRSERDAAREANGLWTSPRRGKRQKSVLVPSQLVAESQSLLSPESHDSSTGAVEVNVESQLTCSTDFPSDKSASIAPAVKNDCAWSQHLGKPCSPSLPPPKKCSKPNCNQLIHHICMIDWETSQGHDGPLQTVCPTHHEFFNAMGGGGKVRCRTASLPAFSDMDNNLFSGDDDFNVEDEIDPRMDAMVDLDDGGDMEFQSS